MNQVCTVAGCGAPLLARGWCKRHYNRWRQHGDPSICLKPLSERGIPMAWLRSHAQWTGDECLVWPFARAKDGRAHMSAGKPSRLMCALVHGAPPSRIYEAAHSCGNAYGGCVNPKHLRWATPKENTADKELHGTLLYGIRLPQTKLSDEDVRGIRSLKGAIAQRDIASRYGVSESRVSQIINGKVRLRVSS